MKSTGSRGVLISASEWHRAEEVGIDYGLMVVRRPRPPATGHALDLFLDPFKQFPVGSPDLTTDTWQLQIPDPDDAPEPQA